MDVLVAAAATPLGKLLHRPAIVVAPKALGRVVGPVEGDARFFLVVEGEV